MNEEVAAVQVRLEATVARFEASLTRARRSFGRTTSQVDRRASETNRRLSSMFDGAVSASKKLTVALAAVSAGLVQVARTGDQIKQLEARFTALTGSAERGQEMFRNLIDLSLRTGVSMDALGTAFTRFTLAAGALNVTDAQVLQFTDTILKMARLTGTAGNELGGALRQLAQALGSGVLRGDELNSIFEAMPTVVQAIADKLGVSVGEIRNLASEGELVADVVFQAILDKTEEIDAKIAELPGSVSTAAGQMATAWTVFTGEIDKSIGASQTLVGVLQGAAQWLSAIARGMEALRAGGNFGAGVLNGLPPIPGVPGIEDPTGIAGTGKGKKMSPEDQAKMRALLRSGEGGVSAARRQIAIDRFRAADRASIYTPGAAPTNAPPPPRPGMDAYLDWLNDRNKPGGGRRGGGGRRSAGGGGSAVERSLEQMRERLERLKEEAALVGLTEEARARLSAQFERERMVRELLEAAVRQGAAIGEDEIEQARTLAEAIEAQTLAVFAKEQAVKRQAEAAREATEREREMAEGIGEVSDRLISAIRDADSFSDALRRIGFELLAIAANAAFGQGPLGGALNSALGVKAGGILGALVGGGGGGHWTGLPGFAKGAAFARGRVTPFANGGVVTTPTSFAMPRSMGIMGEAGPEAIMPLRRGPGGRLGVEASGGGGARSVVIAPTWHLSGLGLSLPEAQALVEANNRRLPGLVREALRRGR